MSNDQCVGFADCPCRKCRSDRSCHTAAHPNHAHQQDRSYCGICRTAQTRTKKELRELSAQSVQHGHYKPQPTMSELYTFCPLCRAEVHAYPLPWAKQAEQVRDLRAAVELHISEGCE